MPSSTNTLGRYQLVREIARSNDIVYEAFDPSLKRRVALKELNFAPNLVGQQRRERIERFYREAKAAGTLQHPNIVTIFEASEDRGRHFIAMEFLEGQSLRDVLQVRGALPVGEAVEIAAQICDALHYAHQKQVIHRDIKPDNVQALPDGRVKLTDFGIARITSEPSLTADGQVFGTPSYMSPEQVVGKGIDHRSDLFSLGIVLYEMLTGRKPFVGDSVVTITYNIMHREADPAPGIPPHLSHILQRAMAKDPDRRYRSAQEMKVDLTRPAFLLPEQAKPLYQPAAPSPAAAEPQAAPSARPDPDELIARFPPEAFDPPRAVGPVSKAFRFRNLLIALCVLVVLGGAFYRGLMRAFGNYRQSAAMAQTAAIFEEAKRLYLSKQYEEAIDLFETAASLSPSPDVRTKSAEMISNAYTRIGQDYDQQGQLPQASQAYRMALYYNPGNTVAQYQLDILSQRSGASVAPPSQPGMIVVPGGPGEVGRQTRQAMAATYYNQGVAFFNQGRYAEARASWEKVLETAPESDIALLAEQQLNRMNRGE
ncbi:MAG: protein kinase [Armatimonadetes bacterium]|nr:protein kinase [Armatimonadota bacterium]